GEAAGRRRRRLRGETLRRLESLEDRTLMAASINIDGSSLLTYDTDAAASEILTISVAGTTYTFNSTQLINVDSNVPGLTVVGSGSNTVTVQSIAGLQVDVNTELSQVALESTNVASGITFYSGINQVTLGSAASLIGLDALPSPITVSQSGAQDDNKLTLIDTGLIETSVIYDVTATTLGRVGFGGLTYAGLTELTLQGATGGLGQGGQGDSTFNISGASSTVDVWSGAGDNLLLLTSAGSASNIMGAVTVFNGLDSPFDVTVDHSAGVADTVWNLVMVNEGELTYAQLTGFGVGGALNYAPEAIDQLTLRNAVGTMTNSLTVDFGEGNPLPALPVLYDGGWHGAPGAKSDLILIGDPEVGIVRQVHTPSGPSTGLTTFEDEDEAFTSIQYSSISPKSVYDTLVAVSYTFVYTGASSVGVEILTGENSALTGNAQTLLIASAGAIPEFADTHVGNKATIVVDQTAGGLDYETLVNYSGATPVAGLGTLSVVTGSGDDEARLVDLPPGAAFTLQQGAGSDQAYLTLPGTAGVSTTTLDGGSGVDSLIIDAGGLALSAANFSTVNGVTTITGVSLPGGPVSYRRYESVAIGNVAPVVPTVFGVPIHAVEGQPLVNALVGAFTASATARASDF
ncbi:hypothetical protein HK102_009942, partial [Quaeritorhiza haematococci]